MLRTQEECSGCRQLLLQSRFFAVKVVIGLYLYNSVATRLTQRRGASSSLSSALQLSSVSCRRAQPATNRAPCFTKGYCLTPKELQQTRQKRLATSV